VKRHEKKRSGYLKNNCEEIMSNIVINGFSELILELYGPEAGGHARSAVGMAELPFNIPVEIEAEVQIAS
jgi:enamine deaminase RidA (YjgF/YER057c/UK114 family)